MHPTVSGRLERSGSLSQASVVQLARKWQAPSQRDQATVLVYALGPKYLLRTYEIGTWTLWA